MDQANADAPRRRTQAWGGPSSEPSESSATDPAPATFTPPAAVPAPAPAPVKQVRWMPKPGELPSYPSESTQPRVEPAQGNRPPSGAHPIRPPSGSHPGAAASLHQIGEIVGGRYRLNRMLGHGALTETWEATHIALQRSVAIKFLRR